MQSAHLAALSPGAAHRRRVLHRAGSRIRSGKEGVSWEALALVRALQRRAARGLACGGPAHVNGGAKLETRLHASATFIAGTCPRTASAGFSSP